MFESDGRLKGDIDVRTVTCDDTGACPVVVPAPGFALVFLSEDALTDADQAATMTATFATSISNARNTATIGASVLATSNGMSGRTRALGNTSNGRGGSVSTAARVSPALVVVLGGGLAGLWALLA